MLGEAEKLVRLALSLPAQADRFFRQASRGELTRAHDVEPGGAALDPAHRGGGQPAGRRRGLCVAPAGGRGRVRDAGVGAP